MSFLSLLDTTCTLYTTSSTVNRIGEQQTSLTELESSVACRINRLRGNEQVFAQNAGVRIDAKIFMAYRTDFEEWDYILVEDLYYKINSVYVVSDYDGPHHLEIEAYIDKQIAS